MKKYRLSIVSINGQYVREECHQTYSSRKKAFKNLDKFLVSTQIPIYLAYRVCVNKEKHLPWKNPLVEHGFHLQLIS